MGDFFTQSHIFTNFVRVSLFDHVKIPVKMNVAIPNVLHSCPNALSNMISGEILRKWESKTFTVSGRLNRP